MDSDNANVASASRQVPPQLSDKADSQQDHPELGDLYGDKLPAHEPRNRDAGPDFGSTWIRPNGRVASGPALGVGSRLGGFGRSHVGRAGLFWEARFASAERTYGDTGRC